MKQTKYFCDNCEKEVSSKCSLYLVKAAIHKDNTVLVIDSKEVCESCVKETGYDPTDNKSSTYSLGKGFTKLVNKFFKRNI